VGAGKATIKTARLSGAGAIRKPGLFSPSGRLQFDPSSEKLRTISMRQSWLKLLGVVLVGAGLAGCASSSEVRHGGARSSLGGVSRVLLAPLHNATPDETAGRAVTELTATALLSHGIPLAQTEDSLLRGRALVEEGKESQLIDLARSLQCTHVLFGTVTEYRYKSDLDGSPIVSVTMRMVDAGDGATLWQGTSTKMTQYFGSLSRTAQLAVDNLIQQMSGRTKTARVPARLVQPPEAVAPAANPYVPPAASSRFSRGRSEPDVEQIRRRGDQ
jgi:hypothetical protein